MQTLYALYDDRSGLCRWVGAWVRDQPAFVELMFVRSGSDDAQRIAPGMTCENEELTLVSDGGQVYRGDSAWIMLFYALEEFREWSLRLASEEMRPLARKSFLMLSKGRVNVFDWLALSDREAVAVFEPIASPESGGMAASSLQKIHRMISGPLPRNVETGR